MLLANILLTFTTVIALLLGLFILISNSRRPINRVLSAFLFSIMAWLLANLLTNTASDPDTSLIFARTTLIGPVLLSYTFLVFCKIFTKDKKFNLKRAVNYAILPFLIILTFPTSLNIKDIDAYGQNTEAGPIYIVLVLMIILYFTIGTWSLAKLYKRSNRVVEKAQLRYMFVGIGLSLIPGVIANGILPILGYDEALFYAPNTILFLATFTSVAIVKHRLLDIRLIVARSLAYILSLGTLVLIYGFVLLTGSKLLFPGNTISFSRQIFYITAATVLAFGIQPVKKFFDRITNRFFYRDAYDPQVFIDQLNRTLVTTVDIESLLQNSARIIEENLKAEFCTFAIRETAYTERRIIGSGDKKFEEKDIAAVRDATPHIKQRVIVVDELLEDNLDLSNTLRKYDIAVLARLVTTLKYEIEGAGYLMLGPKKSGNPYNQQDINIIRIVANELVIAIQNALRFEEIEKFNITLQAKVDDATKRLRNTNEKLKTLDETKDEFISMASHQLRTPLTSVKGYLSMVLEGDAGKLNETQSKMLDQAFVSSQRMVYLIADLLNVSRLRTGKFVIEPIATNLAEVVEGEISQLKETAASRGLTLTYTMPDNFPKLLLDETKIRQVIMNFTDNAIYYTPSGGSIEVSLKDKKDSVEFAVIDSGIGVPKHEQPHLFTKFYRAGNARKARPDGTGLGLFMAKKVIVAQGGAIIFHSHEGKGSTFGFSFAKAKLTPKTIESESVALTAR